MPAVGLPYRRYEAETMGLMQRRALDRVDDREDAEYAYLCVGLALTKQKTVFLEFRRGDREL